MPALSFFADGRDVNVLLDQLNADPEIAFVVPDGPRDPEIAYANRLRASLENRTEATFYLPFGIVDDGYRQRWKTVRTVATLKDGKHSLWHVPAGPLPLLAEGEPDSPILDPWAGWTERCPGADPTTPFFASPPVEIRLELWTRHRPYSEEDKAALPILSSHWDRDQAVLVASNFQWIGNRYRVIGGRHAQAQTRRWWNRLKAWFRRSATPLASGRFTFWAFPSALRKLKGGMAYESLLVFNMSDSIQTAVPNLRYPKSCDLMPPANVILDPGWLHWNGGTIPKLAQAIYDDRTFDHLPILADALEEAGCHDSAILTHCRQDGEHTRGCWVLNLILGKD